MSRPIKLSLLLIGACLAWILAYGFVIGNTVDRDLEDAVSEFHTSDDPDVCRRLVTRRFLEQVTQRPGLAASRSCIRDITEEPEDQADRVTIVSDIVRGDRAKVRYRLDGGTNDGWELETELIRSRAGWVLDHIVAVPKVDREPYYAELRESLSEEPFAVPERTIACITTEYELLDPIRFEAAVIGAGNLELTEIAVDCGRRPFLAALGGALDEEFGPRIASCIGAGLEDMSTAEIATAIHDPREILLLGLACNRRAIVSDLIESLSESGAGPVCVETQLRRLANAEIAELAVEPEAIVAVVEPCGGGALPSDQIA